MKGDMKYTHQDLVTMQAYPLNRKIQIAQTRIIEWYQKWNGQVIVSFSGGKDSTVLLHLVRQIYPDVEAVFVDTGLEFPEIKQFVKQHENVTIVRPSISYRNVIEKYGYPVISKDVSRKIYYARRGSAWAQRALRGENADGTQTDFIKRFMKWAYLVNAPFQISDQCCYVMKKQPLKKYQHSSHKVAIVGTMAAESSCRELAWMQTGCNAFDSADPKSAPMSIWT